MGKFRRVQGFTLIELTVILSVIAILTMVLAPAIKSQIDETRMAAAQQEVQVIARAIQAFYTDTGFLPKTVDSVNGRNGSQLVDLMVSNGRIPATPTGAVLDRQGMPVTVDVSGWVTGSFDLLENHLSRNHPGYQNKSALNEHGWGGPYLSSTEITADPWGNRYMVNVRFLEASYPTFLVVVVSAGPNGVIETPFQQPRTDPVKYGDDIVHIIQ